MTFRPTSQLLRHADDRIAWLTTVTPTGRPAPRPVWFVFDGEHFRVFSQPGTRKLEHIRRNPAVTLHFNSDADGSDVLVISATARLEGEERKPSTTPGYLDKYEQAYPAIGHDAGSFDASYSVGVRITPTRSWGF
ncbi:PPOX class probable F420-dependent enzyme [Saccharomonospora marina XMU15]|uniref:PPOX class probable F420-dependent enzyme n=1 Tax=Saccharomonospora marina XMU15 TaxID=882083 RepID=H5XBJ8_9PSEU|nr:TIGR03667 family PPOX class F420-dependent oxidoreductase [Saccharomonospora marina]EHR50506.1 PPOX class probable F420-dependent enzyme [Saccharomonospora marina XMU15]